MSRWIDVDTGRNCDGEYEKWNIDTDVLDEAKTDMAERKKGKWKYEGCDTYSCPFCGDTHVDDGDVYYFCKVCGADMRTSE